MLERFDKRGEGASGGIGEARLLVRGGREFVAPFAGEDLKRLLGVL